MNGREHERLGFGAVKVAIGVERQVGEFVAAPQTLQPQVASPASAGYSFQPKPMIPSAGRFSNEQPMPRIVKQPFMDTVSQKIEGLKDFLKQKKRSGEVDLSAHD